MSVSLCLFFYISLSSFSLLSCFIFLYQTLSFFLFNFWIAIIFLIILHCSFSPSLLPFFTNLYLICLFVSLKFIVAMFFIPPLLVIRCINLFLSVKCPSGAILRQGLDLKQKNCLLILDQLIRDSPHRVRHSHFAD